MRVSSHPGEFASTLPRLVVMCGALLAAPAFGQTGGDPCPAILNAALMSVTKTQSVDKFQTQAQNDFCKEMSKRQSEGIDTKASVPVPIAEGLIQIRGEGDWRRAEDIYTKHCELNRSAFSQEALHWIYEKRLGVGVTEAWSKCRAERKEVELEETKRELVGLQVEPLGGEGLFSVGFAARHRPYLRNDKLYFVEIDESVKGVIRCGEVWKDRELIPSRFKAQYCERIDPSREVKVTFRVTDGHEQISETVTFAAVPMKPENPPPLCSGQVWNKHDKSPAAVVSSNGLRFQVRDDTFGAARALHGFSSGKWYWEVNKDDNGKDSRVAIGVATKDIDYTGEPDGKYYLWGKHEGGAYRFRSGEGTAYGVAHHGAIYEINNGRLVEVGRAPSIELGEHVVGTLLDVDERRLYFAVDGRWVPGHDPAKGEPGIAIRPGSYYPAVSNYTTGGLSLNADPPFKNVAVESTANVKFCSAELDRAEKRSAAPTSSDEPNGNR